MAIVDDSSRANGKQEVYGVRRAAKLAHFDEEAIRNSLIHGASTGLIIAAESSYESVGQQAAAIRRNTSALDDIVQRLNQVFTGVQQIDATVTSVVDNALTGCRQLEQANAKMQALIEHCTSIDALAETVNGIADQANMHVLAAATEVGQSGDHGKAFDSLASKFQDLTASTKETHREMKDALRRVSETVDHLCQSVGQSAENVRRSIETIHAAKQSTMPVESESSQLRQQLHDLAQCFRELADSSTHVENGMKEVKTIGSTFGYVLEIMALQGAFKEALDPLARLFPLVRRSTFYDPHRFADTEDEYVLADRDVLISATDTNGVITFANNRFYEVAEFSPGELTGRPHNVMRHPDMPKTAFADLWAVIKAGKTWQGYVKNRSKSGRGYWVKANVFPCFEARAIVGYVSIRMKPDRQKVRQAIEAYRRVP